MIAGSGNIQGGFCNRGIAHACGISLQRALWFDGAVYVDYGYISPFRLQEFLFTANLFFSTAYSNPTSLVASDFTNFSPTNATGWGMLYTGNDGLFFYVNNGQRIRGSYTTFHTNCANRWISIAMYRKGTVAKGMINGLVVASFAVPGSISYPGFHPAQIGHIDGDARPSLTGVINNIRMFDTAALSISAIEALAASPDSGSPIFYARGNGCAASQWQDVVSEALPSIPGSPSCAYLKKDGNIVVS